MTEKLTPETRKKLGGTYIQLTGGVTHYQLSGPETAPAVVLVHGNAAPMISWDNNVKALTEAGFRVLRYDIFGHGFSDRPNLKVYNQELYIRQLGELTEALKIQTPFHLAGTSQGGAICAAFAAEFPQKVKKIALLAPLYDDFSGKKTVKIMQGPFGKLLINMVSPPKAADPSRVLYSGKLKEELLEKIMPQFHYKGKKRAVLANLRGNFTDLLPVYQKLATHKIPILLTWGENDRSIPRESMERLSRLSSPLDYHIIPLASHLAHYEFPEIINPLLTEFFKQ